MDDLVSFVDMTSIDFRYFCITSCRMMLRKLKILNGTEPLLRKKLIKHLRKLSIRSKRLVFSALNEMSSFTFSLWCIKLISFILCHQGLVAVTGQQINEFLSSLDNLIMLCIKFICLWPILCQSSRKVLMMTLVLRLYLPPMVLWIYISEPRISNPFAHTTNETTA